MVFPIKETTLLATNYDFTVFHERGKPKKRESEKTKQ